MGCVHSVETMRPMSIETTRKMMGMDDLRTIGKEEKRPNFFKCFSIRGKNNIEPEIKTNSEEDVI